MGTGSMVDFTSPAPTLVARQARRVLELGVEGIKADDGEGYYFPPDAASPTGGPAPKRPGATAGSIRRSMQQRARRGRIPARASCSAAAAGPASRRSGMLWGGDQASDFWSLRTLVAATLTAAPRGFSNWSHDVGGYLGERLVERCPKELLVPLGCSSAASPR